MSEATLDVDSVILDAIDHSIRETFDMMIGQALDHHKTSAVTLKTPTAGEPGEHLEEITVVVGLTGGLQGSVSVCLSKEAALLWTEKLIDHQCDTFDQTVIDAIGELGNMVVGGAKGRMEDFVLTLGLPSVVLAGTSRLAFPSNCTPVQLTYSVDGHFISAFIALV